MADNLSSIRKSFADLGIELKMGIEESNIGACTGEWIVADDMHELVSLNPSDGQPIASIIQADEAAYEKDDWSHSKWGRSFPRGWVRSRR